jgi:hypothetical protein
LVGFRPIAGAGASYTKSWPETRTTVCGTDVHGPHAKSNNYANRSSSNGDADHVSLIVDTIHSSPVRRACHSSPVIFSDHVVPITCPDHSRAHVQAIDSSPNLEATNSRSNLEATYSRPNIEADSSSNVREDKYPHTKSARWQPVCSSNRSICRQRVVPALATCHHYSFGNCHLRASDLS